MIPKLLFYDKEDRPWPGPRLTNAAIVGHTTETSARIWVRVKQEGDYCLVVSKSAIDTNTQPRLTAEESVELIREDEKPVRLEALVFRRSIRFQSDNTAVFDVPELSPGTRYFYALFSDSDRPDRWVIGRDEPHRFRTQESDADRVTFGLFSCHMPFKGRSVLNQDMWESFGELLKDMRADFVIGCGDQVYTDGDKQVSIWKWLKNNKEAVSELSQKEQIEVMTSWYRDIYRGYWGDLALRRVFRSYPTYMIWDDHEIMDGWGSYTKKELSNTLDTMWEWEDRASNLSLAGNMFEAAKSVYHEYQHSHNPDTPESQWDYHFQWAHLAFYVLDMRGHRDYSRKTDKVLSNLQGKRFLDWLQGPEATAASAVFVVSPVPVVHLMDFVANWLDLPALGLADDLRDEWEHESNYSERNKILGAVFDFSAKEKKPVVFLSGDVHIGAAFKLTRRGKRDARVFQLTSSGITYCKAPGRLLQLVVRNLGDLKGLPEADHTSFQRLHIFEDNNFGFVHSERDDRTGTVRLAWDLYGSTGREEEVVRLKRIPLK